MVDLVDLLEGLIDLVEGLVDLGESQVVGLVGLVNRDGLDPLADLQVLKVLIPILVPMGGVAFEGYCFGGFF